MNELVVIGSTETKGQMLANRFNVLMTKTAESILEMGLIAYEANKLSKGEHNEFSRNVRIKSISTMKKLSAIGDKYDQFREYLAVLPPNWTTLYELTQMPTDDFEDACKTNRINPTMTGKEVGLLLGKTSSLIKKTNPPITSHGYEGIGIYVQCRSISQAADLEKVSLFASNLNMELTLSPDYMDWLKLSLEPSFKEAA
jgi:hypothetical protein